MAAYDRDLSIFAFRYALGRMTYATNVVAEHLIENWHLIPQADKVLIRGEIDWAIAAGQAGMEIDKEIWEQVRDLP